MEKKNNKKNSLICFYMMFLSSYLNTQKYMEAIWHLCFLSRNHHCLAPLIGTFYIWLGFFDEDKCINI